MFSIFHFVRKWPKSNKTKLSKKIRLSKLQLSSQTWTNKTIQSSGFCIDHFFSKFYFFTFIYDLLAIFFAMFKIIVFSLDYHLWFWIAKMVTLTYLTNVHTRGLRSRPLGYDGSVCRKCIAGVHIKANHDKDQTLIQSTISFVYRISKTERNRSFIFILRHFKNFALKCRRTKWTKNSSSQ